MTQPSVQQGLIRMAFASLINNKNAQIKKKINSFKPSEKVVDTNRKDKVCYYTAAKIVPVPAKSNGTSKITVSGVTATSTGTLTRPNGNTNPHFPSHSTPVFKINIPKLAIQGRYKYKQKCHSVEVVEPVARPPWKGPPWRTVDKKVSPVTTGGKITTTLTNCLITLHTRLTTTGSIHVEKIDVKAAKTQTLLTDSESSSLAAFAVSLNILKNKSQFKDGFIAHMKSKSVRDFLSKELTQALAATRRKRS